MRGGQWNSLYTDRVSLASGRSLAAAVTPWLLLVGVASVAAGWFYTGGPRPHGYLGLGEVFVFVFFGLVATVGSAYVHQQQVPAVAWLAATAVGFLACALLVVNNLRDLPGDAEAGKKVFAKCMTCHSVDAGVNKVGPTLHGVVGRHSGSVEGYSYSDANKNSGITWTPEELYVYLADPQATIPGTKMAFPGLKDPQDRANVIAYLQTQS